MKLAAKILAEIALVVLLLDLAIFYLRLGWFLILIWPFGAALALVISWKDVRPQRSPFVARVVVLVAYVAISAGLWHVLFDRKEGQTFEMTWRDEGDQNDFHEAEIVLEFRSFPGQQIGFYSNEVRDFLQARRKPTVEVAFEVTRDFSCMRAFKVTRIGELRSWRSAWGYARTVDNARLPWREDPWWCP